MKKVYFVRHGESEGNIGPIRQTGESPLTERGRAQAEFVATRCAKLPIDIIVSSTMTRARQTAEIIHAHINVPRDESDLFVERRRTSVELGRPKDDPAGLEAARLVRENFHVSGYRHSDEENFDDLKSRAGAALDYLRERPEQNILVVTHGYFMRALMARVVMGEELTSFEGAKFIRTFHMENTGITVLVYDEKHLDSPWWFWMWNDHAHLG